jgi:Fe-S cluster assembly protein SufD
VKGTEKQSVDVRNVFDATNGAGEITLKGIAEEKALAVCNGMIEITERGRGTDTYLTEDVLMLDSTAKVDAIPGLEIRTNDVKASHSATVSRVTAEDLFYLQSRGIDVLTARRMFVDGFLAGLAESISHTALRENVLRVLHQAR